MSEVHYFPRYSQQENVVTNNTLLLFLRLRDYSRFKFEKFMEAMCGEQDIHLASSWLRFQQQKTTGKSVVDGFIAQDSVKIVVETKLNNTFSVTQLHNHLEAFGVEQQKLLILLSPSLDELLRQQFVVIREKANARNIQVLHASFEDIVKTARQCLSPHDEEMQALVADYEAFCSELDLLPRDEYTLFVPPCGQSFADNIKFRLYYCSAERSVRKARYIGVYRDKSIRAIGRIAKVVACNVSVDVEAVDVVDVVFGSRGSLTSEEQERIVQATKNAPSFDWDISKGHKFYLCDQMEQTGFQKTSPGGMQKHRYFDLEAVLGGNIPNELTQLADRLQRFTWE